MINDVQHWRSIARRSHRRASWAYLAASVAWVLGAALADLVWPALHLSTSAVAWIVCAWLLMSAAEHRGWMCGSDETMRRMVQDYDREAYPDEA